MPGLIDAATAVMSTSSRRLEAAAQNIANVSTPGYKRRLRAPSVSNTDYSSALAKVRHDMAAGKVQQTGNPLDLAIGGEGWFRLRKGEDVVYSRQGGFRMMPDGTVATSSGAVLQTVGGGDLVLESDKVRVAADGTVYDGDAALARIDVVDLPPQVEPEPIDGALFRFSGDTLPTDTPNLRQGMIEASNVSIGDEMVTMMAAMRQAESGARLVQTWDELMGRAIGAFGQSGR